MTKYAAFIVVFIASLLPNAALALIGEPAPPLNVKEWVVGGPVDLKANTNIVVVEIWQTSITSARRSIAVFNAIQKHFQTNHVVVVGVCDESPEALRNYIQTEATNVAYVLAADDQHKTSLAYMNLVEQRRVPYVFVVGTNGLVLWHGSSPQFLTEILEQVADGKYDLERAKKVEIAGHQLQQYLGLVGRGDGRARAAGHVLLASRTNDAALLCDLAIGIATAEQGKRDFILASAALSQAEKLATTNVDRVAFTRAVVLFETGHTNEALTQATQALALAKSPRDKKAIETGIHTMQARMAAANSGAIKRKQQQEQALTRPLLPTTAGTPAERSPEVPAQGGAAQDSDASPGTVKK
jgi:peroxiredoxin